MGMPRPVRNMMTFSSTSAGYLTAAWCSEDGMVVGKRLGMIRIGGWEQSVLVAGGRSARGIVAVDGAFWCDSIRRGLPATESSGPGWRSGSTTMRPAAGSPGRHPLDLHQVVVSNGRQRCGPRSDKRHIHWSYLVVLRRASGCARNQCIISNTSSMESSGSGPAGGSGRCTSSATTARNASCSIGVAG
jgi:hypothetical protein